MAPKPPVRPFKPRSTRISTALRAPELSAIFSIVSCCPTLPPPPPSARAPDDFDHTPPLRLRERSRLHDAYGVALLRTLVVVGRDLLGADHLLAVEPVREAADQRDRHGLLHLVAHHDARADLATPPHACFLSRKMVLIRAISRRIVRNCSGFAIASVPRRNARRKRSSTRSASFCSSSSVLSSRNASGFCRAMLPLLPFHELRLDRQLRRGERERLARQVLGDPLDLEHHAPRLHDGHPALRVAPPLPPSGPPRLLGCRLVGKQPDPDFAAALHLPGQRHA